MTKYYRDEAGNYLGGFEGAEIPEGAIEVDAPPAHGHDMFVNNVWIADENRLVHQQRRSAYPSIGDQLDAIWKELSFRRDNGEVLDTDTNAMLDAVLGVKSTYPKS